MDKRYFIDLSYNGSKYHGWQVQPNAVTVQEVLQKTFSTILQEEVEMMGCGRTDTGVHAKNFIAHFNTANSIVAEEIFRFKINCMLPKDIAIHNIYEVNPDAHSRFNACSRTYHYYISTEKNPFAIDTSWYCSFPLNIDAMQKIAAVLLEYNDFASFCKSNAGSKTTICNISEAYWRKEKNSLVFSITADRFLRNMVRAIVGTCINGGRDKISLNDVRAIIESKDRSKAGFSVPPNGLFLDKIVYPQWIHQTK